MATPEQGPVGEVDTASSRASDRVNYDELLRQARGAEATEALQDKDPYEPKELARLMYESFRFAQGRYEMHKAVCDYLADSQGPRITESNLKESQDLLDRSIKRFVEPGKAHAKLEERSPSVESEVGKVTDLIRKRLEENELLEEPRKPSVHVLTEEVIMRDHMYVAKRPDGRARAHAAQAGERATPNAQYLSQLMYYGLEGNSTHTPEYDAMFQDMAEMVPKVWDEETALMKFNPDTGQPMLGRYQTYGDVLKETATKYWSHYPEAKEKLRPEFKHLFEEKTE